jgi:hypothetical protein
MATFNSYVSLPEGTSTTLLANPRVSDPQISMLLKQKEQGWLPGSTHELFEKPHV